MKIFADDSNGVYPQSGGTIFWNKTDPATQKYGWMQQILSYVQNTNVYHCPANRLVSPDIQSFFNYFNGVRAAYVITNGFAAVEVTRIQFPDAFVLSGDTIGGRILDLDDSDKDDYTQNCVGGPANGNPWENWQVHRKGQNVLFEDGHAKWYAGYATNEMTFRYDAMHGWE